MNATAAAAVSVLTRPFARIPELQRRRICLILLTAVALVMPFLLDNDAEHRQHGQRRGLRHAGAGAEHRGRVRRPAGPWLCRVLRHRCLHLRHPDRVPAAAGVEQLLGAVPLPGSGRQDAGGDRRRQRGALHPVVLDRPAAGGGSGGVLRHPVRRADAAAARRLPRHRHAGLRRDRADRGAQLVGPDQRRRRPERRGCAAPVRLELRRRCDAVLLRCDRDGGAADLHQHPIARLRASAVPGWRSARTRSPPARWASTAPSSSCWRSPSAPRSAA